MSETLRQQGPAIRAALAAVLVGALAGWGCEGEDAQVGGDGSADHGGDRSRDASTPLDSMPNGDSGTRLRGSSPGWPIDPNPRARLLYLEDYESGTCDRIQEGSSAAVVSREDGADVRFGRSCLRGNFDPDTEDPITGKKGTSRYAGLSDIPLASLGVVDTLYVSYWWRLDPDVRFEPEEGGFGGQKHAYVTGSASPWAEKVNYVVGQAWGPDHWWVVNNSPNDQAISFKAEARVDPDRAALGVWHRIEFYLKLESRPGARDGVALLKVDGQLAIEAYDVPYLWPGAQPQTWGAMALPSMFGGPSDPAASFGWQLDELEVWNDLPPPQP